MNKTKIVSLILLTLTIITSATAITTKETVWRYTHSPCQDKGFYGMGGIGDFNLSSDSTQVSWSNDPIILEYINRQVVKLNQTSGTYAGNDTILNVWECTNDEHEASVYVPEFSDYFAAIASIGGLLVYFIRRKLNS